MASALNGIRKKNRNLEVNNKQMTAIGIQVKLNHWEKERVSMQNNGKKR